VDVIVPRLLRRERIYTSPPEASVGPSLSQQLEEAQQKGQHAAMMAASLAARGGLLYSPPLGIDIREFQKRITMQDQTKLENSAGKILADRAAIAEARAAAGITAAMREIKALPPLPSGFFHSGGGGGGGAGAKNSTPAPLTSNETILIPQQQQQHVITAINQAPQQSLTNFPQALRRGPRKRSPSKAWKLTPEHNIARINGKLIQILVQSSKKWHPALVSGINPVDGSALLVFESDMQRVVPLKKLIENGQVAWFNKEIAVEQNSSGDAGVGTGADGVSRKRRRAAKDFEPSKNQNASPRTSSVDGGDSLDIAAIWNGTGMDSGGVCGIGEANGAAAAAGVPAGNSDDTTVKVAMDEEEEELVLKKLEGVTKRQQVVAAKKVPSAMTSPDSKLLDTGAVRGVEAVGRAGSGADATFSDIRHDQRQQHATLLHPLGFNPSNGDAPLALQKDSSIPTGNAASYGDNTQQQQQHNHQQAQQEQQAILSNGSADTAPLLMPHIFQLGDGVMRGKAIQLTIKNINVPALVLKVDQEKQSVVIAVHKRPVVLKAEEEGIKYQLAFIFEKISR